MKSTKSKSKSKSKSTKKPAPRAQAELTPQEALKSLGRSSTEVARTLGEMGITGDLDDDKSCPIARFLDKRGWDATVTADLITCIGFIKDGTVTYQWLASAPIRTFVEQFDAEKYPQLVRRQSTVSTAWYSPARRSLPRQSGR